MKEINEHKALYTCPFGDENIDRNTPQFRHFFIFSLQLACGSPRHSVPLMNQQRFPV